MQHYLAQPGSWVTVIEGVIFVFCVLVFRHGIVGVIAPYVVGRKATIEPAPERYPRSSRLPHRGRSVKAGQGLEGVEPSGVLIPTF